MDAFVPALFSTSIPTSFNIYVNVLTLVYNGEHWNTRISWHYSVVGEIKLSKGGKSQNQEQMVGLWQNDQKVMLGLVVDPTQILPQYVRRKFFAFIMWHLYQATKGAQSVPLGSIYTVSIDVQNNECLHPQWCLHMQVHKKWGKDGSKQGRAELWWPQSCNLAAGEISGSSWLQ